MKRRQVSPSVTSLIRRRYAGETAWEQRQGFPLRGSRLHEVQTDAVASEKQGPTQTPALIGRLAGRRSCRDGVPDGLSDGETPHPSPAVTPSPQGEGFGASMGQAEGPLRPFAAESQQSTTAGTDVSDGPRNGETPHPSPAVTPSPQGEGFWTQQELTECSSKVAARK